MNALWPLLLFLTAGCAAPNASLTPAGSPRPDAVAIQEVPVFEQRAQQCGAASLASLLHWSGIEVAPKELESLLYNPERRGTLQPALLGAARRQGALAYEIQGRAELLAQLESEIPVLVLQNKGLSWFPFWHYAVVCGLDPEEDIICLLDGSSKPRLIREQTFLRTWARANYWGLVVLPPGKLPADADRHRYLQSVYALEQGDQHALAQKGYQAALQQWPGDLAALLGKANCFYSLNKLRKAEKALRKAVKLHPESAPAWNNLAQVLAEQGKDLEALQAVQEALKLGGEHLQHYQQTKDNILSPSH